MSILDNTKKIWRRSLQRAVDPVLLNSNQEIPSLNEPVTFAVIGCGQRGNVNIVHGHALAVNYSLYATELF